MANDNVVDHVVEPEMVLKYQKRKKLLVKYRRESDLDDDMFLLAAIIDWWEKVSVQLMDDSPKGAVPGSRTATPPFCFGATSLKWDLSMQRTS
jgi:hypothetical protein